MKLKVMHENGRVEILDLNGGEWRIEEGPHLNRIIGPTGFTHFFTHDGEYDGWGAGISETPAHANDLVQALEEKRQFANATA